MPHPRAETSGVGRLARRAARALRGPASKVAAASAEIRLAVLTREFERNQTLLDLTIGAAELGTFDLDVASGELNVNSRLLELSGLSAATFSGTPEDVYTNLHPEDREQTIAQVQTAIATGGLYSADYRVLDPDGTTRWLAARGATVGGEDGTPVRLLGAVYDITGLRANATRSEQILDDMAVGYLSMDTDWRIGYVNVEGVRALGMPREKLVGNVIWDLFPGTVGTEFEAGYRRAAETGRPVTFDAYYPEPLNAWYEVRATPEKGGVALYFLNISDRKAAQQAVEAANARLQLMAEVSRELSGNLEAERAVARLAQLVVPVLADWAVITLVDGDAVGAGQDLRRGLRDVGWWHAEEDFRPLVAAYASCRLDELPDRTEFWDSLRRSGTVVVPDAANAIGAALSATGRARPLLTRLNPASATLLPLRARGRTVGLMSLFAGPDRGPLTPEELTTAEEVATRAAQALDSARLYRLQRNLAEGLQRSLLSDPVQPDHVQIVVRYLPAAAAAQVGGDWYDAFGQPSGATVLVIGDVVGHDTEAAAAMSQVRTVVRSLGSLGDDSPAAVLRDTDRVMANLRMPTTATVLAARLEQNSEEHVEGTTRLRWSNAGHPPAMLLTDDGTVTDLDGEPADLLLGVDPETDRTDHEVLLDRGATLVLYTDGLVERRDQNLTEGLDRLRRSMSDLAREDTDLDGFVDRLLVGLLPAEPEDDVAVIAVRLHPQDRPRPDSPT